MLPGPQVDQRQVCEEAFQPVEERPEEGARDRQQGDQSGQRRYGVVGHHILS